MPFRGYFKLSSSFLRLVHKFIYWKYNCAERRVHLLVTVVQIGEWVGQIKFEHCSNFKKHTK